jgi:hypothetical protein
VTDDESLAERWRQHGTTGQNARKRRQSILSQRLYRWPVGAHVVAIHCDLHKTLVADLQAVGEIRIGPRRGQFKVQLDGPGVAGTDRTRRGDDKWLLGCWLCYPTPFMRRTMTDTVDRSSGWIRLSGASLPRLYTAVGEYHPGEGRVLNINLADVGVYLRAPRR